MSTHQANGRRNRGEQQREETRRRLIDAARELIADKGVEGLRLREIGDRADVGFGSFYNHFATKEELVEAVVTDSITRLAQAIVAETFALTDPAETLSATYRCFLRLPVDDPQLAWLIVHLDRADALFDSAVMQRADAALRRGIEAGRFPADLDIAVTRTFFVGATIAVMRGMLEGRLEQDADVAGARALLGAVGIGASEAAAIAERPPPQLRVVSSASKGRV